MLSNPGLSLCACELHVTVLMCTLLLLASKAGDDGIIGKERGWWHATISNSYVIVAHLHPLPLSYAPFSDIADILPTRVCVCHGFCYPLNS